MKICGITRLEQAVAIANLGIPALGFIRVSGTPRYVSLTQAADLIAPLPPTLDKVGVYRDPSLTEILKDLEQTGFTSIQLHGQEPPDFCAELKRHRPEIQVIKALRVRSHEDLETIPAYLGTIDKLLLDAYHPHLLGGTGQTLDWSLVQAARPRLRDWAIPWVLAGGLSPDNIAQALALLEPDGVDLSSGVENKPGDKSMEQVMLLLSRLPYPPSPFAGRL